MYQELSCWDLLLLSNLMDLLCDTTPRRASVATNGLWRVAARARHEPPADTCSVVSAHPLHSRSIKIHNF